MPRRLDPNGSMDMGINVEQQRDDKVLDPAEKVVRLENIVDEYDETNDRNELRYEASAATITTAVITSISSSPDIKPAIDKQSSTATKMSSNSKTFSVPSLARGPYGVVGPFGKALARGVEYSDSVVGRDENRIQICENWRLSEPNGKTNMRLRLVDTFGPDVDGPSPLQYSVNHKQNSRIEGVGSSRIISRPKPLRTITTTEGSGKLVYDLRDSEEWARIKPGPKIIGVVSYDKERPTTSPSKVDAPSKNFLAAKKNGLIKNSRSVKPRKTLEMSTLSLWGKYKGHIANVRDQSLLAETRPSPMDYIPNIDLTRPRCVKTLTIPIKFEEKESNMNKNLVTNGHAIPGPGSYSQDANAFGYEDITPLKRDKNLRPKPIDRTNFNVNMTTTAPIKKLNPQYKSAYSFPKNRPVAQIVLRGQVHKSSISLSNESQAPWFN